METEAYLSLPEATRCVPGKPAPCTVWRWYRRGILPPSGERVYLDHLRAGRRVVIRPEALFEFMQRLAEEDRRAAFKDLKAMPENRGKVPSRKATPGAVYDASARRGMSAANNSFHGWGVNGDQRKGEDMRIYGREKKSPTGGIGQNGAKADGLCGISYHVTL